LKCYKNFTLAPRYPCQRQSLNCVKRFCATDMPNKKLTKLKNIIEITGLSVVLPLVYLCFYPLENYFSKIIADNTVIIMLVFFLAGFLSIFLKLNNALIYCWLSCAALCHHLKDTQINHFYYTKADSKKIQIQIAHYDIEADCDLNIFSEKINKIKTNVLSLRLDDQMKNDSIVIRLKKNYPYHFFCDLNKTDNKIRYIFSKYEIDSIETFSWNDESLMLGTVNIDKNIGKIYFLNLSLNENDLEENDSSLYYLNKFTTVCKEKYFKNQPAVAFGDTPYFHWHPGIRDFRNKNMMKDSRLDMELNLNRKHIFYTAHLDCIRFLQDENGVVGVYQLNDLPVNMTKEVISLNQ
jgi:hypothetical protein